MWPLCRDSVGVSQAQQICGDSRGRKGFAERNSTGNRGSSKLRGSVRQRNDSVKKLWCPVDAIYISHLLSNCVFVTLHDGKYLAKLKKAATFQTITKQNCLNAGHNVLLKYFKKHTDP